MTVMNSGKLSTETLNLPNTYKYILGRKSTNAMTVKMFSEVTHPMGKMWTHLQKRRLIYIMNVGKASMIPLAFKDIIHTGKKSMNIYHVGKPSAQNFLLFYIRECKEINHMSVLQVSVWLHIWKTWLGSSSRKDGISIFHLYSPIECQV